MGVLTLGLAGVLACRTPQPATTRAAEPDAARSAAREAVAPTIPFVERVTGGASATDRLPLVVAMHGFGDTPEAFVGVFDGMPTRARVVALRAFDSWSGGWSWFRPGLDPNGPEFAHTVEAAAHRIARAIREIAVARPSCRSIVVTGFSQGAMLSYTLAALEPDVATRFVPVAGRLGAAIAIDPRRGGDVRALHGDADARVPIDDSRAAVSRFAEAGRDAHLETYPGVGHTISMEMRRDLFRAIAEIADRGCP
jgi:phospholipase/carboxylesterase